MDRTICDWKNFMRDVCKEIVLREFTPIGVAGHRVQIDESLLSRRKNHQGRMYPQIWLFCGIDTTTKNIFLAPVKKRNRERLIPIIQRHVLAGTTIVSDCWRAYDTLGELGYTRLNVNHTQNFVDPTTGAHTNTK